MEVDASSKEIKLLQVEQLSLKRVKRCIILWKIYKYHILIFILLPLVGGIEPCPRGESEELKLLDIFKSKFKKPFSETPIRAKC